MVLACIIEPNNIFQATTLIDSIFKSMQKKITVLDFPSQNFYDIIKKADKKSSDILIIKTNLDTLSFLNSQNLKLDILVFEDSSDISKYDSFSYFKNIMTLLKPNAYLIVNSDNFDFFNHFDFKKYSVITYGFNKYATVSTSSIGDFITNSNFMCFIRKTIHSYNGIAFEPQEYILKTSYADNKPYTLLLASIFAIVNGIDLNKTKI